MTSANSTSSDHGSVDPSQSIESVFAELDVKDGNIHVGLALRDKLRPYDQPTVLTVDSVESIADFLSASPDQVHYLMLAKDGQRSLVKISYSARSGKYNVQAGKRSLLGKTFDVNFISGIADQIPIDIWQDFSNSFSKQD